MRIVGALKKTATLGLKITPALKARLQSMAKTRERSLNWLAAHYIEIGLERDEKGQKGETKK